MSSTISDNSQMEVCRQVLTVIIYKGEISEVALRRYPQGLGSGGGLRGRSQGEVSGEGIRGRYQGEVSGGGFRLRSNEECFLINIMLLVFFSHSHHFYLSLNILLIRFSWFFH